MWIDDQVMAHCEKQKFELVWVPEKTVVVLGRGNSAKLEVRTENCSHDHIEILRRKGGGGTVVLHSGCVVLSVGMWVGDYYKNTAYFKALNQSVIDVLIKFIPSTQGRLAQNGVSDITLDGKKIVGTSLFRSRNYMLYQGSLLVESRIELIERYLRHPSSEPEYRRGRSHRDFVTGLAQNQLQAVSSQQVSHVFQKYWGTSLQARLKTEMVGANPSQLKHHLNTLLPTQREVLCSVR